MKTFFNFVMAITATMLLTSSCNKAPMNEPGRGNTVNITATKFIGIHFTVGGSNSYMVTLSDEEGVHNYVFSLYSQLGEIDDNGYVTIPFGTYTSSEDYGDYRVGGYCIYVDMSEGAENPKSVDLTESTVVVAEDKIVLTTVVEGVTHVVTYNGAPSMPADLPEPDVNFEAKYAYAYYTDNTSDDNIALFQLYLSDLGCEEDGNALPNGTYYELVMVVKKLGPNAEIAIPAGKYEIGDTSSAYMYIEDAEYYKFGELLSERADHDYISSGTLTVNADGSIEASFDMKFSGSTHNVSFSGDIEILENMIPAEAPYSTLTSDKECDLSNHSINIWYGDSSYGGYQSYLVSISSNNIIGDNIGFQILRDHGDELSGKYTVSESVTEFAVVPGYVDGFSLNSSWYYQKANYMFTSEFAPIVGGWVEIQVTDNDVYTVTFDVYDDLNNNITGTLSCVLPANL